MLDRELQLLWKECRDVRYLTVPALRKNLMHKSDGPRESDDYLGDDEDTNQPRIKFEPPA